MRTHSRAFLLDKQKRQLQGYDLFQRQWSTESRPFEPFGPITFPYQPRAKHSALDAFGSILQFSVGVLRCHLIEMATIFLQEWIRTPLQWGPSERGHDLRSLSILSRAFAASSILSFSRLFSTFSALSIVKRKKKWAF